MAENKVVTTSFVVSFTSAGAGTILKAEVDDREDGFNKGDTSGFGLGKSVGFLVFSNNLDKYILRSSMGTIDGTTAASNTTGSPATKKITELVTFANESTTNAGYPVTTLDDTKTTWFGTNHGALVATGGEEISCASIVPSNTDPKVGVAEITYTANCNLHILAHSPPGAPKYEIVVFALGTPKLT